ncbi:hypothetical protein F5H01DRAFT_32482 [Linnemannia elongata]|nr:hypothetical protein F5H01DRAFT_32482 [Linnemannia elongata]
MNTMLCLSVSFPLLSLHCRSTSKLYSVTTFFHLLSTLLTALLPPLLFLSLSSLSTDSSLSSLLSLLTPLSHTTLRHLPLSFHSLL